MPCDYEAYVPDPLVGRTVTLDGAVAADVTDAETAVMRLDARAATLADTEGLARLLLRAESVASSRIEGLEVGARKLLRSEAARQLGERAIDLTAAEVLGNINAMNAAVHELGPGDPITPDTLLAFHRRLMASSRVPAPAGQLREQQNWIGGSDYNPCSAAFVPPPPELVPGLIEDLCAFCNDDSLPAVAQAALAHAQFETIHPFPDGNGRTGRGLIHLVLRRRGLATRVLPPISLVLATWANDYIDGLTATRYSGPATSDAAQAGLNRWIGTFAGACARAAADAGSFENRVEQIESSWRAAVGQIRSGSATDRLLRALPGAPVLSVSGAAELIGRSYPQVNEAIGRLVPAGVLTQISVGKRNRAFEAKDIINAFTDLERQLASPGGDTRSSAPSRPVPPRRPLAVELALRPLLLRGVGRTLRVGLRLRFFRCGQLCQLCLDLGRLPQVAEFRQHAMGLGQQLACLRQPSRVLLGQAEPAQGRRLTVPLAMRLPDGE
jgi:Fic family protein